MLNKIVETAVTVFDALFLIWFIPSFLKTSIKKGIKPWNYILPAVFLAFVLFADRFLAGFDLVALAVEVVISFLFALSLGEWRRQKFATVLATCLLVAVAMFTGSGMYAVFSLFIDDPGTLIQGSDGPARIIYLVSASLLKFLVYKLILVIFRSNEGLDRKNGIFVLLCFSMTAVGLGVLMYISSVSPDVPSAAILLLVGVILLSNVAIYFTIYQIQKFQKKEFEIALLRERLQNAQKTTDEARTIWENIRRFRHELKNYLTVISGKLSIEDVEGCQKYISELTGTVEHFGNIIKTDNAIIDFLINSKLSAIDNIVVTGYVGDFSDIDDVDLACLIGNILDNAVEAEEKIEDESKRMIELHFLIQNQNRIIICKNAIDWSVIDSNPELHTTKEAPDMHGIGHLIIAETAEKYSGFVEYSEEDGMFKVTVILPKA